MTERFEFEDGSFYEFERPDKAFLETLTERKVGDWYAWVIGNEYAEQDEVRYKEGHTINLDIASQTSTAFKETYVAATQTPKSKKLKPTKPGEKNENVIGVFLTVNPLESTSELSRGVYLPIMFSHNIAGGLFIDITKIVSKVIYEPTLLPSELKVLLRER